MTVDWLSRIVAPVVDLGPGAVDLRAYRGDDFAVRFHFRYADDTPVVLAGTWRAQIRLRHDDPTALDEFAVDATEQDRRDQCLAAPDLVPTRPRRWRNAPCGISKTSAGPAPGPWFSGGLYTSPDRT